MLRTGKSALRDLRPRSLTGYALSARLCGGSFGSRRLFAILSSRKLVRIRDAGAKVVRRKAPNFPANFIIFCLRRVNEPL